MTVVTFKEMGRVNNLSDWAIARGEMHAVKIVAAYCEKQCPCYFCPDQSRISTRDNQFTF